MTPILIDNMAKLEMRLGRVAALLCKPMAQG
jgi:hypothetical protein